MYQSLWVDNFLECVCSCVIDARNALLVRALQARVGLGGELCARTGGTARGATPCAAAWGWRRRPWRASCSCRRTRWRRRPRWTAAPTRRGGARDAAAAAEGARADAGAALARAARARRHLRRQQRRRALPARPSVSNTAFCYMGLTNFLGFLSMGLVDYLIMCVCVRESAIEAQLKKKKKKTPGILIIMHCAGSRSASYSIYSTNKWQKVWMQGMDAFQYMVKTSNSFISNLIYLRSTLPPLETFRAHGSRW